MGVNGIYGLSGSGLDIESMVKVGMMGKQNEYDKMAQKYTKNEWTKAAYLELSNQITTFNMSTLTQYKLSSNMNAKTASSSNESAVTVTANAGAANMSHKVSVDSLSTNAYLIGKKNAISDILAGNGVSNTSSIKLQDILFANGTNRDTQEVTSTYNRRDVSGNTVTYWSSSSDLPVTAVTTGGSGANRTLTIGYTPTSGEYTTYSATGGSTTTTTKTVQYTDYTSSTGSSNFTLKEITDSVKNTNDDETSSSIRYKIAIDGTNKEYTKSTSSDTIDALTTDTYTSTDGSSTISITRSSDGNVSVSIDGAAAAYYTETGSDSVDIEKTETTTYNNATMTKKTTANRNGQSTEETKIHATNDDGLTIDITENYANGNFVSATTVAQEDFINNRIVYDSENQTVSSGLIANTTRSVSDSDTAIAFKIGDGKNETEVISFTYGDLANGKTINDLVSEINSKANNANINVKAAYDNNNELFSLYNSKGGEENQILITAVDTTTSDNSASNYAGNVAMNFFNALGLKQSTGDSLLAPSNVPNTANVLTGNDDSDHLTISSLGAAEGVSGTNGKITVDGVEYDNITDNKVTVGGVTYNALNKTTNNVTVTVSQDVDGIVDKVKSFVESYNKILSSLYEKYDEKGDSNYKPLTQSQKDSMKDEQIEKWEEKAKQGLLYHDSTLGKIINDMRNMISTPVEGVSGTYTSAYSIGISTTGIKGQLVLDETRLKNALSADSDSVYNVFAKLGNVKKIVNGQEVEDTNYNGIAQRLGDVLTTATKSIKTRAGSSADITEDSDLNNLLRELQTKMSNFKKLMTSFEDRLYKKYDAMEVALTKLGSQLSFITGGQ